MRNTVVVAIIVVVSLLLFSQSGSLEKWGIGTIVEVKSRAGAKSVDTSSFDYDVSIKVGDTIYAVLYTAPPGRMGLPFRAGRDLPVLVRGNTLTFVDVQGKVQQAAILSTRRPRPSDAAIK